MDDLERVVGLVLTDGDFDRLSQAGHRRRVAEVLREAETQRSDDHDEDDRDRDQEDHPDDRRQRSPSTLYPLPRPLPVPRHHPVATTLKYRDLNPG